MSEEQKIDSYEKTITLKDINRMISEANTVLLNKQELKFFGIVSCSMEKFVVDPKLYSSLPKIPALGWTDGKDVYYIMQDNSSMQDILFITIHELLHILSKHIKRLESRDPILWNLAADHVCNRVLYDIIHNSPKSVSRYFKWLNGCFFIEDLHKREPGIEAEQVYEFIENSKDRFVKEEVKGFFNIPGGSGNNNGSGSDSDNNNQNTPQGNLPKVYKIKDKKTGQEYYVVEDTNPNAFNNPKEVEEKLKDILSDSRSLWNSNVISKGNMPGGVQQLFDKLFKIEIPWDVVLENTLMYKNQNRQEKTWGWPNEIIRNVRLPGELESDEMETVIAVVDTSGSVSDQDLNKFISLVCDTSKFFNNLIFIAHDYVIHDEIFVEDMTTPEQVHDRIKKLKGRGGTSHREPLKKIGQYLDDGLKISSILFMTDYESDVQYEVNNNPWMKEYETIWILNRKHTVHLKDCETVQITIN